MIENLIGFGLILTRLSAFLLVLPIFGWQFLPVRMKMALVLLLTIFFGRLLPFPTDLHSLSTVRLILLMINEATYGLALGLIIAILFNIVKISGRIIERQMGLAMAEVIDPLSGDRTQPLGGLLEMIFILFLLSANAHHALIQVIYESYQSFPVGTTPTIDVLTLGVVEAGSALDNRSFVAAASFDYQGSPTTLGMSLRFNEDIRIEQLDGVEVSADEDLIAAFVVSDWLAGIDLVKFIDDAELSVDQGSVLIDDDGGASCSDIENTIKKNMKESAQIDKE